MIAYRPCIIVDIIIVFLLLQWNARSLIANSQEFKRFIEETKVRPDIVCIQETWLRPHLDTFYLGDDI